MPSIGSAIGGIGQIAGGIIGGNAAHDASQAQVEAAKLAIAEQQREYDQSRADHAPWLTTGGSALDRLAGIYGLDTSVGGKTVLGSGQMNTGTFWQSPDYQFAKREGLRGVDAGAAASGSLDSGATRKAEIGYAGNLASGQFNNYVNRLAGIAGVGQVAADSNTAAGTNAANQISNQYGNIGNAQASAYLSQGQQYGNMIGGLAGMFGGQISNGGFSNWFGGGSGNGGYTSSAPGGDSNWINQTNPWGGH